MGKHCWPECQLRCQQCPIDLFLKKKRGTDLCIYVLKEVIGRHKSLNRCMTLCLHVSRCEWNTVSNFRNWLKGEFLNIRLLMYVVFKSKSDCVYNYQANCLNMLVLQMVRGKKLLSFTTPVLVCTCVYVCVYTCVYVYVVCACEP